MATDRRAEVTWKGSLLEGSGTIQLDDERRARRADRQLARALDRRDRREHESRGAHRRCARRLLLDGALGGAREGRHPPEELKTSATVTFQPGEGITKIALAVVGRVPGLDAAAFEEAAQGARPTARSRRRSRACRRSRSTRRSLHLARRGASPGPTLQRHGR